MADYCIWYFIYMCLEKWLFQSLGHCSHKGMQINDVLTTVWLSYCLVNSVNVHTDKRLFWHKFDLHIKRQTKHFNLHVQKTTSGGQ